MMIGTRAVAGQRERGTVRFLGSFRLRAWLARQGRVEREVILVQPGNFRTMSARRDQYRDTDDKAWPVEN